MAEQLGMGGVMGSGEGRSRPVIALAMGLAVLVALCACASSASAKSAVFSFSNEPSSTQAGGHPNIVSSFVLGTLSTQGPPDCTSSSCNPKNAIVHAPAGVIANPHVVSECTTQEISTYTCSGDAQVGLVALGGRPDINFAVMPLFRVKPQAGQAALLAFVIPVGLPLVQYVAVNGRTGGDFGLDLRTVGINQFATLAAFYPLRVSTLFWGVPGDPSHDKLRATQGTRLIASCGNNPAAAFAEDVIPIDCQTQEKSTPSSLPPGPFTQAPTTCAGPLTSSIDVLAYDGESDHAEAAWPATTGCDLLSFDPSLAAAPTTTQTDTASGLALDVKVPQFQDPNTPSPSALRETEITLPEGLTINPNAADGKTVCTDAEARFGSEDPAECPEFSKVGTTVLDSSALPGPIPGYVYLGKPEPGNPYRLILTAGGFGTHVKLEASVRPDPQDGQIVVSLVDLPQAPFQQFGVHIFGSERGLLATAEQCGQYPVETNFVPWAAELSNQTSTQFFNVDSGPGGRLCPNGARPLGPGFQASSSNNTAGMHTPFSLRLTREDGEQNITGVSVSAPPGFAATLKGVPYCPEPAIDQLNDATYSGQAETQSSACPAASLIGTATAGAGAGTRPLYVGGKVYLAGPYKGAPLSLVVVVPAVSGPYDLGVIAVRTAIKVDPATAQVSAVSDPLPQIVEGIPLRTRFIQVNLDRSNFTFNPTNCNPFSVSASISGDEGAVAGRSSHFQSANCTQLPFAPKLSLKLSGGLKRRGHPAIKAVYRAKPGEANTRRVSVTLPRGELLDNSHIGTVCTRVDFAKDACPTGSVYGSAEASTPLLDESLKGKVYLRSSSNKLPDLVVDLEGQIDIELAGRIDSVDGALRTTFEAVPDAPVTRFVLNLKGGSKGLLINSESLCGKPKRARAKIVGQNGVRLKRRIKLQTACGSKARGKRRAHARKAG